MWAAYYAANGYAANGWTEGSNYTSATDPLFAEGPFGSVSGGGAAIGGAGGGVSGLSEGDGLPDDVSGEGASEEESSLPRGWKEARDLSGRAYYFHAATGETQWQLPTYEGVLTDRTTAPPPNAEVEERSAAELAMGTEKAARMDWEAEGTEWKEEWKEAVAGDGRKYFYRPGSGETQWTRPDEMGWQGGEWEAAQGTEGGQGMLSKTSSAGVAAGAETAVAGAAGGGGEGQLVSTEGTDGNSEGDMILMTQD